MLIRKLLRTAWKYKAQFISMIIMVAIGMGIFLGANMEWYSIERNVNDFIENTEYYDYRIYTENRLGFSEEDIDSLREIDGITTVTRYFAVNVGVKDTDKGLNLVLQEPSEKLKGYVATEGSGELTGNALYLSDKFAKKNGIGLNDEITLTYRNLEITGKVVSIGKSSEHMICVSGENQLMPDFENFGFVYASPDLLTDAGVPFIYPQIGIQSDLSKAEIKEIAGRLLGSYKPVVTDKSEHTGYAGALSEIEEVQTMGAILPVLFLLIAILTMVTTMHRITANEKVQIGTLKALGFKNSRITRHYTVYGLFIGIVGTVIGIFLGYGIARLIFSPTTMQGTYFDLPTWNLYMPWWCALILVAGVAFLTLISFLSVKKTLRGTAAETLRPYVPKKVKPLLLERTRLWDRMSFATRWNLRDVFRHKARSLMTLIGILGCMILLVGGLGMKDTMAAYLNTLDNDFLKYETRVNISAEADKEEVALFAEELEGDLYASTAVVYNDKNVGLEIYNITHGNIGFINAKNNPIEIGSNGAYLCMRLSGGVKVGDTIEVEVFGSDEVYELKVAGFYRSVLSESIVITEEYAKTVGVEYSYSAIFTQKTAEEVSAHDFIESTQSKKSIMESYDAFLDVMNTMVLVFALGAVVLGVVVLYNLGIMSYVERSRELATLKVVGFKNSRIGRILISQNLWLTIVGIILGIPAGIGVLYGLIAALATEYELKVVIGALTYCVSIFVTFGVSLVVGLLVARKNKKIDMVEALKGVE